MTDFFDQAIDTILEHEGLYVNNPNDSGMATNFGISLRFLKDYTTLNPNEFDRYDIDDDGDIDAIDIQGLPKAEAVNLYKTQFWDKYGYGEIKNYLVAVKLFDLSVNMGGKQAHKIAQRAVRAATGVELKEDGVLGPKTKGAVNSADPFALLSAIKSEAAGFYRLLTKVDPNLSVFLTGWLKRAYY